MPTRGRTEEERYAKLLERAIQAISINNLTFQRHEVEFDALKTSNQALTRSNEALVIALNAAVAAMPSSKKADRAWLEYIRAFGLGFLRPEVLAIVFTFVASVLGIHWVAPALILPTQSPPAVVQPVPSPVEP